MKTGNRSTRTFEFMRFTTGLARRKNKSWTVVQIFQLSCHDTHHAFVKLWIKHAQSWRWRFIRIEHVLSDGQGLVAHVAFDYAAFAVDAV